MNQSPQTPDFSRVWGPFLFAVALPWHYGIKSSSFLTASGTVEGYRWPYVRRVVWTSSWPRRSLTSRTGQPRWMRSEAWECPYGIITTNRKSPVESRLNSDKVLFSFARGRERCGRNGHAVFLRPGVDFATADSEITGISTSSTKLK